MEKIAKGVVGVAIVAIVFGIYCMFRRQTSPPASIEIGQPAVKAELPRPAGKAL